MNKLHQIKAINENQKAYNFPASHLSNLTGERALRRETAGLRGTAEIEKPLRASINFNMAKSCFAFESCYGICPDASITKFLVGSAKSPPRFCGKARSCLPEGYEAMSVNVWFCRLKYLETHHHRLVSSWSVGCRRFSHGAAYLINNKVVRLSNEENARSGENDVKYGLA